MQRKQFVPSAEAESPPGGGYGHCIRRVLHQLDFLQFFT
jgi:hypothetical protein